MYLCGPVSQQCMAHAVYSHHCRGVVFQSTLRCYPYKSKLCFMWALFFEHPVHELWWGEVTPEERVCVVSTGREKLQGVVQNRPEMYHMHQIWLHNAKIPLLEMGVVGTFRQVSKKNLLNLLMSKSQCLEICPVRRWDRQFFLIFSYVKWIFLAFVSFPSTPLPNPERTGTHIVAMGNGRTLKHCNFCSLELCI